MNVLLARWNGYWFAQGPAWPLSVFRMLWSVQNIGYAFFLLAWFAAERGLPALPYPGFSLLARMPFAAAETLGVLYLLASLAVLLGWHTRMAQAGMAVLAVVLFFHTASDYQNHFAFLIMVNAWLTFVPSQYAFSLDAQGSARITHTVSYFGQRLILLQAAFLYLFSALGKLDPSWLARWSETPEAAMLMVHSPFVGVWQWLVHADLAWIPLVGIAVAMLALAVCVLFGRHVPVVLLIAGVMHILFDLSLPVLVFTPMMLSILFLAAFPPMPGTFVDRLLRMWNVVP
jgi:hypothetical protein